MLNTWFNLPLGALFAAVAVPYVVTALIIYCASHRTPFGSAFRTRVQSLTGIVAPFFGGVAVLFALLTGFLANDISDRNRQATRAVLAETDGLHTAQALSVAAITEMSAIREALHDYAQSVLKDEWPYIADNGRAPKTETAFAELLKHVADPAIASNSGQAVHTALLNSVARIGSARSDRLALAEDRTNHLKWLTVILLGIITQISLAMVHLDKPRAQAAALTIYSFAVIVTLTLIAAQEQPFAGAVQISAAPLENFLDSIKSKP